MFDHHLERFKSCFNKRDPVMEYKILTRINCHKQKYDMLYRSYHADFKHLNKYPDILTFANNRVLLGKPKPTVIFNINTQQTALSNVSQESLSENEERDNS
jgi:succinylglutamate desuccinylase